MTERSMLAAVSGIEANQTWIDSIGNNIANADTVGYKNSEVQFQDLLSEQLAGASGPTATSGGINPVAVGSGVRVAASQVDLQEGSLQTTGNPTDVAISGSGYLVVDNAGQQLFTRDGSLTVDANGDLTTQSGGLIQGWQANGSGVVSTNAPLTSIKIPTGETIGATPTSQMTLGGNLPAWSGTGTPPSAQTTTLDAYDSLGNTVPVTVTFTPVVGSGNTWTMSATVPNPGGSGTTTIDSGTTVSFTNGLVSGVTSGGAGGGTVTATTGGGYQVSLTPTWPAGYEFPAGSTLSFEVPPPSSPSGLTQYAASSTVAVSSQNGYPSGTLQSFSIGNDGTITGSFSSGATLALGQIALSNFTNPGGLADQGGGLYATSPNSGQALIGTPGSGGRGSLLGGQLEQSNVNLGTELTELITAQEAYTANTKTLTTSSAVVQALENVP